MKIEDLSKSIPPSAENVGPALLRAAQRARLLAFHTGTAYVTWQDGKLVEEKFTRPLPPELPAHSSSKSST